MISSEGIYFIREYPPRILRDIGHASSKDPPAEKAKIEAV